MKMGPFYTESFAETSVIQLFLFGFKPYLYSICRFQCSSMTPRQESLKGKLTGDLAGEANLKCMEGKETM